MAISFDTDHNPIVGKAEKLEDDLVVITANNASPMTFTGTRSYILGTDNLIVIDPGPDINQHFDAIMDYIGNRKVTDIILTHSHVDHSPLSRRLKNETGASIIGFGSADEARTTFMKELSSSLDLGGEEGIDKNLTLDEKVIDEYSVNPPNVYGFGHQSYYEHVVDCIKNNTTQLVDGYEGRKSLKLIIAIYESIESGKEVFLNSLPNLSKLGKNE